MAILVKTPGRSPIKTRLAAALGTDAAVEFFRSSARAVRSVVLEAIAGTGWTAYWAVAEPEALAASEWSDLPALWQGPGDLGPRLARIDQELHRGHRAALLLGADSPQLSPELLRQAMAYIAGARQAGEPPRFAVGPATDGGFYLYAGSEPLSLDTWTRIAFSRPTTGDELEQSISALGRVLRLPVLTDVDVAADISILQSELCANPRLTPEQRELAALVRTMR